MTASPSASGRTEAFDPGRRGSLARPLAWGGVTLATACSGAPSVLAPRGSSAATISTLGWIATGTMAGIAIVVCALLVVALSRDREADTDPYDRGGRGVRWLVIGGIVTPALILGGFWIYNLVVLRAVAAPEDEPAVTVRVTGWQWWWEATYLDEGGDVDFVTANELHVPTGRPVKLMLESSDVIHSFWIPELGGKTDLIPGRTNETWIEADEPGTYHGQCAEFCGASHANMRLRVIAEEPAGYTAWTARMREPAEPDSAGFEHFREHGCAACHRIAGTMAQGTIGPDLTHIGSRRTIAAGLLENTPANLADWLRAPDSVKAGALMPDLDLDPEGVDRLVDFLESLE